MDNLKRPILDRDLDQNLANQIKLLPYALNATRVKVDSNVMLGILLISELSAYIFIDSKDTRSFIPIAFIVKSCIACENINSILEITIPLGIILNTGQIAGEIKLEMDKKRLKAYLYLLNMKDFIVILQMD